MINVLHLIDTGGPGGAETVFLHTATGLDPARFSARCVMSRDDWLADELRRRGFAADILPASGSFNLGYLRQLASITRESGTQLIVAHLYGSAVYGAVLSLVTGIPMVAVLHGQSDIANSGRLASVKRLLVRARPRHLVFVSARLRDELAAAIGADADRCIVIANGVDVAKFSAGGDRALRTELALPADAILVGAVGNIRRPKDYPVLLHAAQRLVSISPRYHFAIAGEGSGSLFEELKSLRDSLGLAGHVHFLGMRKDVAGLLPNFDVYALSSITEGFSIACVEAMAAGVPVVATRSGGPEEIVEHGRSGLLVPTRDPEAMASAIEQIVTKPEWAATLTRAARERVAQKFTLQAMLDAYAALFEQTAKR